MKFRYLDFAAGPSPAFPARRKISRPVIRITIKFQAQSFNLWAFVDSGADYCYFPSELGEALGLNVRSGARDEVRGVGNQSFPVYFHQIEIIVGGHSIQARVGFGDEIAFPVLGQTGFFDHFELRFNFKKLLVELTPLKKI